VTSCYGRRSKEAHAEWHQGTTAYVAGERLPASYRVDKALAQDSISDHIYAMHSRVHLNRHAGHKVKGAAKRGSCNPLPRTEFNSQGPASNPQLSPDSKSVTSLTRG
jgi:hypothetical protein